MLRRDLYDAMPFEALPAVVRQLPVRLQPHDGEALVSWLHRLAARLRLPPRTLLRDVAGLPAEDDRKWWRRPDRQRLSALRFAARLSVSVAMPSLSSRNTSSLMPSPPLP
ncbi:MAG: TniQ family protein [Sphingobium sp.]